MNGLIVLLLVLIGLVIAIYLFVEWDARRQPKNYRAAQQHRRSDDLFAANREEQLHIYRQAEINRAKREFVEYLNRIK